MNAHAIGTATFAVLMPNFDATAQIVPDLGRLGIDRRQIYIGAGDPRSLASFAERLGVSTLNLDRDDPLMRSLRERLPKGQVAYLKKRLTAKRVLLVLPAVNAGQEVAAMLHSAGADFGPAFERGVARETRIPLRAERLDVKKYLVQSGAVHVFKEVVTEIERVEVTLVREEFVVERTPLDGSGDVEIVRIPLQHEDFAVTTHTVVTNEVSIRRQAHEQVRHMEQPVRYERVLISKEGDVAMHEVRP